ncbi:MAG: DUF4956 domain-containing protein [Clostridia bacterium]|nr:DUF4956 domain-containing protein [Clostridia bacterium]
MDFLFNSIINGATTPKTFLICSAVSLVLGCLLALAHSYKGRTTTSFSVTVALIPIIVQTIIMLVNGNLGTGIAVAGAFSLVRFRSVPGSAKEILSIFMAMTAGLATGVGYVGIAAIFTIAAIIMSLIYEKLQFGNLQKRYKEMKITIPESLNYTNAFDDIFEKYTVKTALKNVKTTNMGSLYKLNYEIEFINGVNERDFIDELRTRNGNLEIMLNFCPTAAQEL